MDYRKEMIRTYPKFGSVPGWSTLNNAALGLCGESGEFAEHIKKFLYQGKKLDVEAMILELGDIRWYLELAAAALEVTMQEIEEANIAKLRKRYPPQMGTVSNDPSDGA